MRSISLLLVVLLFAFCVLCPVVRADIVMLEAPSVVLTTDDALLTFDLVTPSGKPLPEPGVVALTINASGDAAFADITEVGTITAHPTPGTIEVESVGGTFAVRLSDATAETVNVEGRGQRRRGGDVHGGPR